MANFHIRPNGEIGVCRAKSPATCPFSSRGHYSSIDSAMSVGKGKVGKYTPSSSKPRHKSSSNKSASSSKAQLSGKRTKAENGAYATKLEEDVVKSFDGDTETSAESKRIAEAIKAIKPDGHLTRTGQQVKLANGDFLLDDIVVELKSVGSTSSTGTYYNTSISAITNYVDVPQYNEFLKSEGYYDQLKSITDKPFSDKTTSPFKKEDYKRLSKEERKAIADLEKPIREKYVSLVFDKMQEKPGTDEKLFRAFLNKQGEKELPDVILVSDRVNEEVKAITKEELQSKQYSSVSKTGSAIVFNDAYRMQFGWQNGSGLSNPTIRVFLENKKE